MKDSKFLKKEDCEPAILVTITGCHEENVAKQGAEPEMKWCLTFEEHTKPFVLNSTNAQIIAKFTGEDDTDNWIGQKVVLYHDPNISFGNKIVGGIRVRAPKKGAGTPAKAPPKKAKPPVNEDADECEDPGDRF
jgi:hypothetical protein